MPTLNSNALFMRTIGDGWSLYASSTFTSDNPATNVQTKRPGIFSRSTDTSSGTPCYVRLDAGSAAAFDPDDIAVFIGYVATNGTAPKWRVRCSTASDFSTTTFDSGSGGQSFDSPFSNRSFVHAFANLTDYAGGGPFSSARYLEVSLWATSATYVDVGRILVGTPAQFTRNIQPRGSIDPTPLENTVVLSGDRGQQFVVPGARFVQVFGEVLSSTESEVKSTWNDLLQRIGQSDGVLYVKDPTEVTYRQQQYVYGRLIDVRPPAQVYDGLWTIQFTVEEFH